MPADGADTKQKEISDRQTRVADDCQDHQRDCCRPGKTVHESHHKRPQPMIRRQATKPAAIEPRQGRAVTGMAVVVRAVAVRMSMHVIAVSVNVIVQLGVACCAEDAAHARQREDPEQNQHDAHGEFHRKTEPWRDDDSDQQ